MPSPSAKPASVASTSEVSVAPGPPPGASAPAAAPVPPAVTPPLPQPRQRRSSRADVVQVVEALNVRDEVLDQLDPASSLHATPGHHAHHAHHPHAHAVAAANANVPVPGHTSPPKFNAHTAAPSPSRLPFHTPSHPSFPSLAHSNPAVPGKKAPKTRTLPPSAHLHHLFAPSPLVLPPAVTAADVVSPLHSPPRRHPSARDETPEKELDAFRLDVDVVELHTHQKHQPATDARSSPTADRHCRREKHQPKAFPGPTHAHNPHPATMPHPDFAAKAGAALAALADRGAGPIVVPADVPPTMTPPPSPVVGFSALGVAASAPPHAGMVRRHSHSAHEGRA